MLRPFKFMFDVRVLLREIRLDLPWKLYRPSTFDNDVSCCNASFTLGDTGASFKPGHDAFVSQLMSGNGNNVTATSTITASPSTVIATASILQTTTKKPDSNVTPPSTSTSTSSKGLDLGTIVGLSVGMPLGALVSGILIPLFWREKQKRRSKETEIPVVGHTDNKHDSGGRVGTQIPPTPPFNAPLYEAPSQYLPSELSNMPQ
ncbi:hypothetical protein HYALB_00006471 [Hymenoscyphus albidus]|uniref:Mid2 domain-containing protein n=1 Tax=Hymenoscyphus albidus TaxID=595503 RepID=A0A9N9LDQ2_9HELO|nr:hypothetical protein HYALB_00006471 [Hymenoscyphus albidus]